jgi:erythronate-4-phosphate dehydrogenase
LCLHLGVAANVELAQLMPAPWLSELTLDASADSTWALASICRAVYDPRRDDADFRRGLSGDAPSRRMAFDALRKHYPMRREIDGLKVCVKDDAPALVSLVQALGARLKG